jgi:hypothetical protein
MGELPEADAMTAPSTDRGWWYGTARVGVTVCT